MMQIPGIKEIIINNIKKDRYEKYLDLMPDLKSEKNKKLIYTILTISSAIILGLFAINPTLSTIANLQKQLEDSKYYESKLNEKINNLVILDQKYQNIEKDLTYVFDAVPTTPQISTLAGLFQATSNQAGTKLIDLQELNADLSKQDINNEKYSTFTYNGIAQGDFQNLLSFLDKIISVQRIITVTDVSFVKSIKQTEIILQINVGGEAFFKK